jgi:hypothetical protein
MAAEQPRRERLAGAAQLRAGQPDRPGGGLDRHLPVPVTGARRGILAGHGPLITVTAEELGDLGLQRCLHQQLRAQVGDLRQDLRQRAAGSEQLSTSRSHCFPVTVTHLPVTRCQICDRILAYRPGNISEVLTEHYRRDHPEALGLPAG